MTGLRRTGKVITLRPNRASGTIAGQIDSAAVPRIEDELIGALNQLPASIIGTPYGKLPDYLSAAVKRNRQHARQLKGRVSAGSVKPKPANLLKLLTATQGLRRIMKSVSREHRELVSDRMIRVAKEWDEALPIAAQGYEYAAVNGRDINILFELLEAALISLSDDPEPLTKAQARILLRKHAVLSIWDAFHKAKKGSLKKDKLTAVAKALAVYFPGEAGLAALTPSTVRDILK